MDLSSAECEDFFRNTAVPEHFAETSSDISQFVTKHNEVGRKIVLVTSGGTTVPLESRTVRYIDNFSVGTRGSVSAEEFLKRGYAVIFLHRLRSLEPFSRHLGNVIDMFTITPDGQVSVKSEYTCVVASCVTQYESVKKNGTLLRVTFTSVHEYLHLLRVCSQCLQVMGSKVMLYLAAAVSDFHIPASQMPEHKIQSSDGDLTLTLQLVPKMLKPLVKNWLPQAFIVSFKLETDSHLLIEKSRKALLAYKHQLVVANLLDKRKTEVVLVTMTTEQPIVLLPDEQAAGKEIEEKIVCELTKYHSEFCENSV
ncbi:phosphopantothenate--cysteine ligase-like [Gigantopelta aegis]|uniref:phosphopantothenate--cysteine ligase-like n=1 Tax=Gigantopelta aegis TaxID=1735272 RepID=UPI001B88E499|nr:phosphopantothenate--cysteine ligase-like [Gigantopelta aegis]